jgi:RNA-binding protein YhbY
MGKPFQKQFFEKDKDIFKSKDEFLTELNKHISPIDGHYFTDNIKYNDQGKKKVKDFQEEMLIQEKNLTKERIKEVLVQLQEEEGIVKVKVLEQLFQDLFFREGEWDKIIKESWG